MKLIQINGWCGRLNAPLAQLIRDEAPDFICIQEAFAPQSKALAVFRDQYGYVDELIVAGGYEHYSFAATWGFNLGGGVIDVGNVILSKHPLSNEQSFHTHGEYQIKTVEKSISNTRAWQACVATLPNGGKLSLSNYQGYLTPGDPNGDEISVKTLEQVKNALSQLPQPLIFCGDLNVKLGTTPIKVLDSLGLTSLTAQHHTKTTLSEVHRAPKQARDSVACDYIYVSPDINVTRFEVSDRVVSDHKALIVEFEI